MVDLETIRKSLIQELVHQDLRRVFYILKQNIDSQSVKYDDLNLLNARYVSASHDQHIKGTLADEDARVVFNRIKSSLLTFINTLQEEDLKVKIESSPDCGFDGVYENRKKPSANTKGKILYRVPELMQLQKRQKCIVRVAFNEDDLEYLHRKDESTKVEPIRISEVMEVQFVDQSHCDAFKITSISSSEQFVDRDDFTEWIFYVEPLLEGVYDLMMKVSVVVKKYDREIRKDIVLEKKIKVVTESIEDKVVIGDASKNYGAAAGVPLVTADGFEVFEQSIILDEITIPPLDPCLTEVPPAPPPPTPPPSPATPFSWLSTLLTVVGVGMIGVILFFWLQEAEPDLTPKGGGTITQLSDGVELLDDDSKEKYKDKEEKEKNYPPKDSIKKIPDESSPTAPYLSFNCEPNERRKVLELNALGGNPPYDVIINKKGSKDAVWQIAMFQNKDTVVSYQAIEFLNQGDYEAMIVDANFLSSTDTFSLVGDIYKPPVEKEVLKITCTPDEKAKVLRVDIEGSQPPFKIFIDGKQDAKLSRLKKYSKSYADAQFKDGQKVTVKVMDSKGNEDFKSVVIKNPSIKVKPVPPIVVAECFDFNQFDECWVLYMYRKETRANWLMNEEVFKDLAIVENMKLGDFKFFKMDMKTLTKACIQENPSFADLEDATTFVFKGGGAAPKKLKGLVTVEKLKKEIDCFSGKSGDDSNPTNKGGGREGKNSKTKKHQIDLKTNTTYFYNGTKSKGGISIRKTGTPKFRIQLASFSNEENFSKFIDELETLDLPICMRLEKGYYRVYLGGLETKSEAQQLLKKLKADSLLKKELGENRLKEFRVEKL